MVPDQGSSPGLLGRYSAPFLRGRDLQLRHGIQRETVVLGGNPTRPEVELILGLQRRNGGQSGHGSVPAASVANDLLHAAGHAGDGA